MVLSTIISFTTSVPAAPIVSRLTKALEALNHDIIFTIGTKVQDPSTVQITSSWPSIETSNTLLTSSQFQAFAETIHSIASSPPTTIIAHINPLSTPNSTAPPLIEWVKIDFRASDTTPAFQTQIEADFARFESIFRRRGPADQLGEGALSTGWAEESDGVRSFVVSRGWESMRFFEEAVATDAFKEGVGILTGWGAPFELWHVETEASRAS